MKRSKFSDEQILAIVKKAKPVARSPFFTRLVWANAQTGSQSHDAHSASATTAMNRRISEVEVNAEEYRSMRIQSIVDNRMQDLLCF